jgi:hypothetical protein
VTELDENNSFGEDDWDMDDDLFLDDSASLLVPRVRDEQNQPLNEGGDTSSISFTSAATGLPGWTSASTRSSAALVPSAAALAKAQKMLNQWDTSDNDESSSALPAEGGFLGFSSASNKVIMPSAAALASAEKKRKQWESDLALLSDDDGDVEQESTSHLPTVGDGPVSTLPIASFSKASDMQAPALPETPLRSRLSLHNGASLAHPSTSALSSSFLPAPSTPSTPLPTRTFSHFPTASVLQGGRPKPFKSPLLTASINKAQNSPAPKRTPGRALAGSQLGYRPSQSPLVISFRADDVPPSTPERPSVPAPLFATPPQTPVSVMPGSTRKTLFTTPFKPGMGPGEPGRIRLEEERARSATQTHSISNYESRTPAKITSKLREHYRFFNLRE